MNMTRRMKGMRILIPLLCTLCAGCDSEDESLMSTREIGFSTTVASSEAEPGTRAEATTDNLAEIGVFAYFSGIDDFNNGSSTPNYLYNQSVKKAGGVWTYSPVRYWPAETDKVSFFAYAPHTAAVAGNTGDKIRIAKPTAFNVPGRPVISYSVPKGELDLLLSAGVMNCTGSHGTVQFTMKHAMTKAVFKVKMEDGTSKRVTGISVECASSADFRINDANTAVTAENINTSKSTCTAAVDITVDGTAKTVKEFFLIPSHPNDTKVTLTYTDGSNAKTIEATLPDAGGNDWLSGKAVGYTLNIRNNRITDIAVDPDMTWNTLLKPAPNDSYYKYIIATAEDLANFRDLTNSSTNPSSIRALQVADIDMQDLSTSRTHSEDATNWTPIGHGTRYFEGVYNGNGHTISNLKLQYGGYTTKAGIGLFGGTKDAVLVGIHLRDVEIATQAPSDGTGTLVGYMLDNSRVYSCSATGKIKTIKLGSFSSSTPYGTGGLIGYAEALSEKSIVAFCHAKVDMGEDGIFAPDEDRCSVGGLIGYAYGSNVVSCYSLGDITIGDIPPQKEYEIYAGGLIGLTTECNIVGSYSTGNMTISLSNTGTTPGSGVINTLFAGGFIGNINTGSYQSCYSYTTLALTYPNIESQPNAGQIYIGGFIGYWSEGGSIYRCYGDGTTRPNANDFASKIRSGEFIGEGRIDFGCYSASTLNGQTVQEIVCPDIAVESTVQFPLIKYDFSTNSYWTDYRFYDAIWRSDIFWKQTPDGQGHPQINYDYIEDPSILH